MCTQGSVGSTCACQMKLCVVVTTCNTRVVEYCVDGCGDVISGRNAYFLPGRSVNINTGMSSLMVKVTNANEHHNIQTMRLG